MAMIIWTVTHVNRITNTFKQISDRLNTPKLISPLFFPLITAIENTAFMEYVPMKEP